jgi:hypothetical protein
MNPAKALKRSIQLKKLPADQLGFDRLGFVDVVTFEHEFAARASR